MTELDQAIHNAFANQGHQEAANRVYLTFLQTSFWLPVKKENPSAEPFLPLFTKIDDRYFMPLFDAEEKLAAWAGELLPEMNITCLSGHEVIIGIHPEVYLCLNVGTEYYKEFSPDEIKHLKRIVGKIEQLNSSISL